MAESTGPSTRRRGRLGSRLVALVVLVTVPLAALSIVSALNDRREAADRAHERTSELAAIGTLVIEGIVQQTDATLDPQVMVAFISTIPVSDDSVVQVLNGSGQIVARNSDLAEYYGMESPGFAQMKGSDQGTFDGEGVDGVYRLYSYERVVVGGEPLYVMAGISRTEAFSAADTHLIWSLAIIIVLGLAVGVLALAAGRSLVVQPVERLRSAISGFRAGDVTRRAGEIGGPAEVVELGESFDAMADEITTRLENQQRLLDQLEEASEAERQSIAAGIHDEVLQTLSAMGIRVQLMRRGADERQQAELDRLRDMLDTTAAQLRGLLFALRPPEFDRIGIIATLRESIEVRLGPDLDDWSVTGEPGPDVPERAQILLYRIAQQALANIRAHAGAHRVDIRFATTGTVVSMEVSDDGRGFDVSRIESESRPGHIGLQMMRDRARAVGGEITITSEEGLGTTVRADIPFRPGGRDEATADGPDDPAAAI